MYHFSSQVKINYYQSNILAKNSFTDEKKNVRITVNLFVSLGM